MEKMFVPYAKSIGTTGYLLHWKLYLNIAAFCGVVSFLDFTDKNITFDL